MRDGVDGEGTGSTHQSLIFDPFVLDVTRSVLLRDQQPLVLRRQSFDVLRFLVEARGRVVSIDEVVDAVWSVRPAQPHLSVTQCIKDIRRAMGDDVRWMIRAVPGRGYEFKAPVRVLDGTGEAFAAAAQAGPGEVLRSDDGSGARGHWRIAHWTAFAGRWWKRRTGLSAKHGGVAVALGLVLVAIAVSLAVRTAPPAVLQMLATPTVAILPLSASPELAAAGTEHAEEIASALQNTPRGFDILIKTPLASPDRGLTSPKPLGVRYVVDGTLGQDGGRSRMIVRLAELDTAKQVWAGPFDYRVDDPDTRRLVTARIARELAVQIRNAESVRPLPVRIEAGHRVIQARVLFEAQRGAEITKRAKALYDQAVALDGDNGQALMGYTRTRLDIILNGWCPADEKAGLLQEADRAVEHALTVDARSSGAHLLRGVVARARGNHERAVASFEYVIKLNPTYVHGHSELGRSKIDVGKANESIAHIERAFALSPKDPVASRWAYWAGMAAAHVGDYEAAKKWMLQAQQMDGHYKRPLAWLAIAYAQTGDVDKAREALQEYRQSYPDFSIATWGALLNRGNAVAAAQQERLISVLRSLNVKEAP